MGNICLIDDYQCKTLIKRLIKSIMKTGGTTETVVLWLECAFKYTCVFFQAAIKV